MNKTILVTGVAFGMFAVVLGAFAAHALEKFIDIDAIQTFETGVRYQMYHALFLLFLGNLNQFDEAKKKWIYFLITLGVLLFSGSIYVLALNELMSFDFSIIGFITPIGGSFLIFGWALCGFQL